MADFPKIHRYMGRFVELPKNHVNAYVVELENGILVVDSTVAVDSAKELRAFAESFGKPLLAVLMTHCHPDHYTGLVAFPDLPRYASQLAIDFAHREDITKAPSAKYYLGDAYPDTRLFPDHVVADGETLVFDGVPFTYTYLGHGESDADGMWSVEVNGELHVFPGDAVANRTHCFFRDLHAEEWLGMLDRLEERFKGRTVHVHQGHGEPSTAADLIPWQRGYIQAFLAAIDSIEDRSEPVARATQEQVIAKMQEYLPTDATLFLLDYEMADMLPLYWKMRPR